MDFWDILTYAAWLISAILLSYIVIDTIVVGSKYSEDFLLSSREGEDELLAEIDGAASNDTNTSPATPDE